MLSDEQIVAAISPLYAERRVALIALAASRDEYRAIESAACSERDARIAELEQQLTEARKDADRYQWLCGFSSVSMPELTWGRRAGIPKNKLDAAIDAAIKEQT